MFKKLKEKITEEVKISPQRIQQFTQSVSDKLQLQQIPEPNNADDAMFSIAEDEHTSNEFASVPLQSSTFNHRRNSISSMISDVSFLPKYESSHNVYHLHSDLDISASEIEDNASSSSHLGHVSKEQVHLAFQKAQMRYHKYRGRYTDLANHYKELERDNAKMKAVLVETQDKAIRRVAELKEQCLLSQKAKADLEAALRLEIDEKTIKINTMHEKLEFLQSNYCSKTDFESLNEKLQEAKAKQIVSELEWKKRVEKLQKQCKEQQKRLSDMEQSEKSLETLLAQTKQELNEKILNRDQEIEALKSDLVQLSKQDFFEVENSQLLEKCKALEAQLHVQEGKWKSNSDEKDKECQRLTDEAYKLHQNVENMEKTNVELRNSFGEFENLQFEHKKLKESFENLIKEHENEKKQFQEDTKSSLLNLELLISKKLQLEYDEKETIMRNDFESKISSLKSEGSSLDNIQIKLMEAESKALKLKTNYDDVQAKYEALNRKYEHLESNYLALMQEKSEIETVLSKKLKNYEEKLKNYEETYRNLEESMKKKHEQFNLIKVELENAISNLQKELVEKKRESKEKKEEIKEKNEEIKVLKEEILNLESSNYNLSQENASNLRKNADFEQKVSVLEENIINLKTELNSSQEKLKIIEGKLKKSEDKLKNTEENFIEANKTISSLERENAKLLNSLKKDENEKQISQLISENRTLISSLEECKLLYENNMKQLEIENEKLHLDGQNLSTTNANLSKNIETALREKEDVQKSLETSKLEIKSHKEKLNELGASNLKLMKQIEDDNATIEAVKVEKSQLEEQILHLNKQKIETDEKLESQIQKNNEKTKHFNDLQQSYENLKQSFDRQDEKLVENVLREKEDLQKSVEISQLEIKSYKEKLNELGASNLKLLKQIEDDNATIEAVKVEKAQLEEQFLHLNKQKIEADEKIESQILKNNEKTKQFNDLQQSYENLKQSYEKLKQTFDRQEEKLVENAGKFGKIEQMHKENVEKSKENTKIVKENEDLARKLRENVEKLKENEKKLKENEKNLQEKDKNLQEKDKSIQEKDKKLMEKDKKIMESEEIFRKNEDLIKKYKEIEEIIKENENKLKNNEEKLKNNEEKLKNNEEKLKNNEENLKNYKENLEKTTLELQNTREKLKTNELKLKQNTERLKDLETKEQTLLESENTIESLHEQVETLTKHLKSNQTQHESFNELVEKLKEEIAELTKRLQSISCDNHRLQEQCDNLLVDNSILRVQAESKESLTADKVIESLKNDCLDLEVKNAQLQGQINDLERHLDEARHDQQFLRDEIEELKTQPLNLNNNNNEAELHNLQVKLAQYKSIDATNRSSIEFYENELQRLQVKNENLNRTVDETLVTLKHCTELSSSSTEVEYLKNVVYNYMLGKESLVLARVIAAVCKFDVEQTENVLKHEQHKQTLLGQLGLF